MKRRLSVLLIAVMLLTMICTACGSNETKGTEEKKEETTTAEGETKEEGEEYHIAVERNFCFFLAVFLRV